MLANATAYQLITVALLAIDAQVKLQISLPQHVRVCRILNYQVLSYLHKYQNQNLRVQFALFVAVRKPS